MLGRPGRDVRPARRPVRTRRASRSRSRARRSRDSDATTIRSCTTERIRRPISSVDRKPRPIQPVSAVDRGVPPRLERRPEDELRGAEHRPGHLAGPSDEPPRLLVGVGEGLAEPVGHAARRRRLAGGGRGTTAGSPRPSARRHRARRTSRRCSRPRRVPAGGFGERVEGADQPGAAEDAATTEDEPDRGGRACASFRYPASMSEAYVAGEPE